MWDRFWLDGLFLDRSRDIVGMTMKLVRVPSCLVGVSKEEKPVSMGIPYRSRFHFGDFRNIFFVVDAIAQNIAKIPECTLQGIGCPFFLSFLKSSSFPLAIFDVPVADILAGFRMSIDFDSFMRGNRYIPHDKSHLST